MRKCSSSILIALDRSALLQAHEPLECIRNAACLEKPNGKHLTQPCRSQMVVFKACPCTEPLKKLREDVGSQSCPLLREKERLMRTGFSRTQSILLEVHRQRLLYRWRQRKSASSGTCSLNMQDALSEIHISHVQGASFGNQETRVPQHPEERPIANSSIVHSRRSFCPHYMAGVKQALKGLLLDQSQRPPRLLRH